MVRTHATHFVRRAVVPVALLLLSGCGEDASSGAPGAAEAAQIRTEVSAMLTVYQDAYAAQDTARIRSLYVTDDRFRWLEDGRQAYRTVDQVVASFESFQAGMTILFEMPNPDITPLRADLASVATDFNVVLEPMDPDSEVEGYTYSGVMSILVERGLDGWKIVLGHTSSPQEP